MEIIFYTQEVLPAVCWTEVGEEMFLFDGDVWRRAWNETLCPNKSTYYL